MNVDLKKALQTVQKYFPESQVFHNVVQFNEKELSFDSLKNICEIAMENPEIVPWVFRSDKQVKVVFFLKKDDTQGYYTGEELSDQESSEGNSDIRCSAVGDFIEFCKEEFGIELPETAYEKFFEA